MKVRKLFIKLMKNYTKAKSESINSHEMVNLIKAQIPDKIKEFIHLPKKNYFVKGSAGQGKWADIPWVAVIDKRVTKSPQKGYYIVYLCNSDGTKLFLTLNLGVTSVKNEVKSSLVPDALINRAQEYLIRLGPLVDGLHKGKINLNVKKDVAGYDYQFGCICSTLYTIDSFPSDKVIEEDLHRYVKMYQFLVSNDLVPLDNLIREDDETDLDIEDLQRLRTHKTIERNQSLIRKVKQIQGDSCKICGNNFRNIYGELGEKYIEAHHIVPLCQLKGKVDQAKLDHRNDFWVLCSNCHRMVHRMLNRSEKVDTPEEFREKYLKIPFVNYT